MWHWIRLIVTGLSSAKTKLWTVVSQALTVRVGLATAVRSLAEGPPHTTRVTRVSLSEFKHILSWPSKLVLVGL